MDRFDRRYANDDVTMAFTDVMGTGWRTFVLLHGIGMGRIVFSEVDNILASAGRVIAVDLPGFGDSPEPGSEHSLEETAEFVADFIRAEVTGPVVLVGHSMGTQVAAELAYRHPELVTELVLIAPTVNRHERTALKQAARMVQDLTGEGPKVLAMGLLEYVKTNPKWFISKLRFMLGHRIEAICPKIHVPTLVLRGETDRVCPRVWVQEVADLIPKSEMEEIPGHGHEAVIKSPEPVSSMILDFVACH